MRWLREPKLRILAGGGIAVALLALLASLYSLSDISHQAIRLHLRLLGASIYEFHDKTGRWPARAEDLAETSLPAKSPYWKLMLDNGTNVVVWPQNLHPNPRDNAGVLLAYHNRGILAHLGRHWVCWGNLRTEYVSNVRLQAGLSARHQ